jgi:hypothetical protein
MSEINTIYITTQEDLAKIGNVDGYEIYHHYILGADIPIEGTWTPLPAFRGTFVNDSGHRYSIGTEQNPLNAPLFASLQGTTIQDLTLWVDITGGDEQGAIAVIVDERDGESVLISNCAIYGQISGDVVGGLVAACVGIGNVTISGNENHAGIVGSDEDSGGIVGYCDKTGNMTIDGNKNYGRIGGGSRLGGIVGSCYTKATVTGNDNHATVDGRGLLGGIAGYVADESIISDNTNDAYIVGIGGTMGGIIGQFVGSTASDNRNCGDVYAMEERAGGIIGYENGAVSVTKNINGGNITATADSAGGIVGYADSGTAGPHQGNQQLGEFVSTVNYAHRIIGYYDPDVIANLNLSNNRALTETRLTGNNGLFGGLVYNDQPLQEGDPEYGADQAQGADLVCAANEHIDRCEGCVRNGTGMPVITLQPIPLQVAIANVAASIALEQAGLSHILNAEGEKLQAALAMGGNTIDDLLSINDSIMGATDGISHIEAELEGKLSALLEAAARLAQNEDETL